MRSRQKPKTIQSAFILDYPNHCMHYAVRRGDGVIYERYVNKLHRLYGKWVRSDGAIPEEAREALEEEARSWRIPTANQEQTRAQRRR